MFDGGHGLDHGWLHQSSAADGIGKLPTPVPRFLVLPQHQLQPTRHDVRVDLLARGFAVAGRIVPAQHGERDHPTEGVLWTGQRSAETRLRSGDDGAADFDYGHCLRLLVPSTGECLNYIDN